MNWDYLAGFTDGEGYIGLVGRGMRITWGQKDEAMLLAIKHFLESEGLKPTFYVIPAKLPHRPNPICMMNLNSRDDVVKALTELEPRLILKAQKCREVLQWINDNPSKRNIKILDVERLRLMASQGYTLKHASKVMMCSPSKIYQCAKQNGIQFKIGGRSVDGMKIPAMTAEQRREYNRSKARTHTCADCQIKIYPNGRRCVRCALIHRHKTQPESFRGSSMKSALAVTSQLEEQAGLDPV